MLTLVALLSTSTLIFDGKTLNGWEVVGGGKWSVEAKGVLKGTCTKADPQGILVYAKPVRDFEAKLQFRISDGNSGFYFRAERIKEQPLVKGCQAEIDAIFDVAGIWETAGRGWVSKPTPELHATTGFKPGEWTRLEVSAIGSHVITKLNGKVVTDIQDPEGRKEGCLALQLHGDMDMTVEFRDIRLRHF